MRQIGLATIRHTQIQAAHQDVTTSRIVISVIEVKVQGPLRIIVEIGPRTMKTMWNRPVKAAVIVRRIVRDATATKVKTKEKAANIITVVSVGGKAANTVVSMMEKVMIK
jgi:hypothetical protein